MQINHSSGAYWRKQPINFMDRMSASSTFDKMQVITGEGALSRNPRYRELKSANTAYQTFYSIPSRLPEITFKPAEKVEKQEKREDPVATTAKQGSGTVEFKPYLREVNTGSPDARVNPYSYYRDKPAPYAGQQIDIYA